MAHKYRFGLVGCGNIAKRHAVQIARLGMLAAVCDIVPEKADALAVAYKARAYYTIEALLNGETPIDVVAVCSPNGLHALHSIQSLKAGCHVLCEKPMALTSDDCARMLSTAETAAKQLLIVKQNRFNPPVAAVKKLLDEGRLGRIFSVQVNCFWHRGPDYYKDSWRGTKALDGGTLFTQFSHFVDLLYWMLGDVKTVQAVLRNYAHAGMIDFEDTGSVLLEFANGVTGTLQYTVNSYRENMEGSITLFAEKGTLKIGGKYLNELSYQVMEGNNIGPLPGSAPANEYENYTGSMSNHDKLYDNLLDVLDNKVPAAASGYEGMKTVEIIQQIYQTAANAGRS